MQIKKFVKGFVARTASLALPLAIMPPTVNPFTTVASWYGPGFQGKLTANGEIFDQNKFTAASKTLPFGTRLVVKNLENGQTCTVKVNDRGPYVQGRGLDLSKAAAHSIGIDGTAKVVCYSPDDVVAGPTRTDENQSELSALAAESESDNTDSLVNLFRSHTFVAAN